MGEAFIHHLVLCIHFAKEKTEAQRRETTCSRLGDRWHLKFHALIILP